MAARDVTAAPEVGQESGLFLRKSSGLVREIGLRDTIGIGFAILCIMNIPWIFASYQLVFPNDDFYIPLIGGGLLSLLMCMAYAQLVSTFARSGGDYVVTSRIFHPVLGAMIGGALFMVLTLFAASSAIGMATILVPFFFTTLGHAVHSGALITFGASTLTTKTGYLLDGLTITAFVLLFVLTPFRIAVGAVFWFFVAGMVGFFALLLVTLFESRTGFIHAFNHASGGTGAYDAIIRAARRNGFHPAFSLAAAVASVPIGFLVYLGFTFANYAAGELKRPVKTYKIATIAVITAATVLCVIYWAALRHMAGLPFTQSVGALQAASPTTYAKLTTIPQNTGGDSYATLVSGSSVLNIIIAQGTVTAFFANFIAFVLMASRVTFALSFDRLLPTRLADVHPRSHSPVYAMLLIITLVAGAVALLVYTPFSTVLGILLLVITSIFVFGSGAAMVLPYRRKELYDASPKAFTGYIFGVPTTSVLGFLSMCGCLYMVIEIAVHPAYTGGYHWRSILVIGVCATLGLVLYGISSLRMRQKGIDLKLAMEELPPE